MIESGIYSLNYYDYPDDDIAVQREYEIGDNLNEGEFYVDNDFPPSARSLYYDPLHPPKGAIPNESIKWLRISTGDVTYCDNPKYSNYDHESSLIEQGALGDRYIVNALRLIASKPEFMKRLLVSDRFSHQGLYTFKFCKSGKWRYVHIDDLIPCRQSGKVNFSRNHNYNETYAMLVEKAYAKLHGSYEAIAFGLTEKVLHEFCESSVQCIRMDALVAMDRCNVVWEVLERAMETKRLVGCLRTVPDPYTENPAKRKGISLETMYEVIDVHVTSAEPSEDLDGITVGLVCVRILQAGYIGKFTGRWSFGDKLWKDYKEIAVDTTLRTKTLQFRRGLGGNPANDSLNDSRDIDNSLFADLNDEDEPDVIAGGSDYLKSTIQIVQPMANDLCWIQIEDFVELFNRVYVINDNTVKIKEGVSKRFVSKWLPGDFIGGSGGPPVLIAARTSPAPMDDAIKQPIDHGRDTSSGSTGSSRSSSSSAYNKEPLYATVIGGPDKELKSDHHHIPVAAVEDEPGRYAYINDSFTNNPMYPFSVNEKATLSISLFQSDKRWNESRLGEDVREVSLKTFVSRSDRLLTCMRYSIAIAFLIVRLSGNKHRLTEFKLKKIVAICEGVVFSNVASLIIELLPGRYAIIPYTHSILHKSMDYVLHCNYITGQIDVEIEDVLVQRLVDDVESDEDEDAVDYEEEPDDNDLLYLHGKSDDVSIMSYERIKVADSDADDDQDHDDDDNDDGESSNLRRAAVRAKIAPPKLLQYKQWEYMEDTEELGVKQVFDEVGEVMKYVTRLRQEIRKLNVEVKKAVVATSIQSGVASTPIPSSSQVEKKKSTSRR